MQGKKDAIMQITKTYEFCQDKIDIARIFSLPIAISSDLQRANRILDRNWNRIEEKDSLANQAQLQDIFSLIGSEYYADRLKNGLDTDKDSLWLAAFGITEGDRSSGINAKRPGKPSGILQIDIDHFSDDPKELYAIQDKLMELPFIIATFISPSQNGVKALAVLNKPCDFDHAKAMGIACTKVVCDYLDLPGYREGISKTSSTNYKLLPLNMQEKFKEAHIDFSVANDPRKGCFIPVKESHLLLKEGKVYRFCEEDNIGSLTGWYYQGVIHPWFTQQTYDKASVTPNIQIKAQKGRPTKEESDWQKYVNGALNSAFAEFKAASSGNHHQAAITLGRCIKKFLPYIDNLEELYVRADSIIDNWSPKANSPLTEKKTVRDMQAYNDSIDKEQWLENKRVAKETIKQLQQEEQRAKGKDEVKNIVEYVDFMKEQPDYSVKWGKEAVAELMVRSFLAHYRFTPDKRCFCLDSLKIIEGAQYERLYKKIWNYTNENNKISELTFDKAMGMIGDACGELFAKPIKRPDLPYRFIGECKANLMDEYTQNCINEGECIPTLGLSLSELITPETQKEAEIICDFCEGRLLDLDNYSSLQKAMRVAKKECAYYFKYVSQAVTEPARKWQCALAFLSEERGTGKTTMTLMIPKILVNKCCEEIPQSSIETEGSRRFLWAKFEGAVFGVFDDFKDPPMSLAATLRNKIASPTIDIEDKGIKNKTVYNYTRIMVSTNSKEFLSELNSGKNTERRFHLFNCKRLLQPDRSCDQPLKILKRYMSMITANSVLTDKEKAKLMAFRAALILEMQKRVEIQEEIYGEIDMEVPLDSIEFKNQKQLGLEHNKIARIAGNILADERDNSLSIKELYNQIREKMRKPELSSKYILDRMKDSGWFIQYRTSNARWWKFSEEGMKMFLNYDEEELAEKSVPSNMVLTELPLIKAEKESVAFKTDDPVFLELERIKGCPPKEQQNILEALITSKAITFTADAKIKINKSGRIVEGFAEFLNKIP